MSKKSFLIDDILRNDEAQPLKYPSVENNGYFESDYISDQDYIYNNQPNILKDYIYPSYNTHVPPNFAILSANFHSIGFQLLTMFQDVNLEQRCREEKRNETIYSFQTSQLEELELGEFLICNHWGFSLYPILKLIIKHMGSFLHFYQIE